MIYFSCSSLGGCGFAVGRVFKRAQGTCSRWMSFMCGTERNCAPAKAKVSSPPHSRSLPETRINCRVSEQTEHQHAEKPASVNPTLSLDDKRPRKKAEVNADAGRPPNNRAEGSQSVTLGLKEPRETVRMPWSLGSAWASRSPFFHSDAFNGID